MSEKLESTPKRRLNEQGFAVPIAMGMGFVMILISTTMLIRSQIDQVTAQAQKNTAQSLSIGEVGVTRVQSFFKQNRNSNFSTTDSTGWASGIELNSVITAGGNEGWVELKFSPSKIIGHFKIDKYTPDSPTPGIGTLVVLGTTEEEIDKLKSPIKTEKAISSLSVQIDENTFVITDWQRKEEP